MLGLHFVRERIISTDYKIVAGGDLVTAQSPGSLVSAIFANFRRFSSIFCKLNWRFLLKTILPVMLFYA
jgi:hypothetical protein